MNFSKFIFQKIWGWTILGDFKKDTIKKAVIIVVPHTSWVDFWVAILTRKSLKTPVNFIAKKELFTWPFGYYFRWMGGAALDRTPGQNKVQAIAKIFDTKDEFRLALSPEGTRKKVTEWKTGYYYIAYTAKVPIIPVSLNYKTKTVTFYEPFYPTGNIKADTKKIKLYFKGIVGKVAENS